MAIARASKRLSIALFGLGVATTGCADIEESSESAPDIHAQGEAAAAEESVRSELKGKVAALGFDTSDFGFNDEFVRVEGDIILERSKLLAGAYDPPATQEGDKRDKGYRTPNKISGAYAPNVKLAWWSSTNPNTTIRNAYIDAANDFNSIWSPLSVSTTNTGMSIVVVVVAASSWSTTPCMIGNPNPAPSSCALFPTSDGKPGSTIYVKQNDLGTGCFDWTANGLANRARHELGHALGLHHPTEGLYISGTAGCNATTPGACPQFPGYPTLMVKTAMCSGNPTVLMDDDRASIAALYPF